MAALKKRSEVDYNYTYAPDDLVTLILLCMEQIKIILRYKVIRSSLNGSLAFRIVISNKTSFLYDVQQPSRIVLSTFASAEIVGQVSMQC